MILFIYYLLVATLSLVNSRVHHEQTSNSQHNHFKSQVLGGERAGLGRLSFMASLSLPPAKDKRYHFCGGALISPTHVLTAAHCLDGSPFEVRFGSNDLSVLEPNSEVIKVKQTFVHPEFDMFTMANDIAIVELVSPSNKQPALLSGWVTLDSGGPGSSGIVAGWGAVNPEATRYPDGMYDASVPIVSLDQCFRLYGHTLVDSTKLCVSVGEGKDTCSGDSGGPLFTVHPSLPGRYVQVGVISWGSTPCGHTPAVYIRVAYYTSWISSIVPSLGKPLSWFDAVNPSTFNVLSGGDGQPTPISQLTPTTPPTPARVTPFPTRRAIGSTPTTSRAPTPPPPPTSSPLIEDCSCTQDGPRYGSSCDLHDNDPLGAWCWVGDSCSSAVLTWWGAKFVYCVMPDEITPPTPAVTITPGLTEILLSQNWSSGIPSTWKAVDKGDYMAPSKWVTDTDGKQPILRQSSNIMLLEPRNDLPKLGTYLLYTPGLQWMDYELSLNFASTDNDILGVMFRVRDDKNYYRFSIDRQSPSGSRRLVKCLNGVFSLLASDDEPYKVGVFYLLTITVQQSRLQVMINGQRVFDVSDDSHPAGSVALYSWANQDSIFDSVLVSRPGSIATRRLVQPIYGRALSSQQQLHDSLDHPETTTEEGDYNFEQSSSSPQALTTGLIVALVVVLIIAGVGAYFWRKRRGLDGRAKDIEVEDEEGAMTRIKVVQMRSAPSHPAQPAVDLDVQDTCDSPTSRTSMNPERASPPPLPAWPASSRTPEKKVRLSTPERNLKGRSPRTSPCKTSRAPTLPSNGTYQPPVTYSLKRHPSARFSPEKTPAAMPRGHSRRSDIALNSETPHVRFAELRRPKSPDTVSPVQQASPEIVMPSPISVTPELPPFPSTDFCIPEIPEFVSPPPTANPRLWRAKECEESHEFVDDSPSHTHPEFMVEQDVRPSERGRTQVVEKPGETDQPEVWEEIRFGEDSDGSDEGLMEYFDER